METISNARTTAVSSEASDRADAALQSNIEFERDARLAEVDVERARINALLDGTSVDLDTLQEVINAYTNADTNILSQITTTVEDIQSQLEVTNTF